ncbi:MAG: hypothetical protein Q9168_004332 [Polycauliona sp. 1 TL-2023]
MLAVFEHVRKPGLGRAVSEKQVLRLVREGHLLEEIDLENLSFQVRLDEEKFRSQQIQDADRYVVLVIKRPAVALRYQLPTGEVRRIQMNFRPDSGYDHAVNVFRAHGVPISDKNLSPPASQGSLTRPVSLPLGNSNPYHYLPSDLGIIPTFDRACSFPTSSSQPRLSGPQDSLHSPTRLSSGHSSLLPDPNVEERATSSYVHSFSSSYGRDQSPERPATAPLTLTQLMPPKRKLPFAKDSGLQSEVEGAETPKKAFGRPTSRAKAKQTKQPSRPSSSRAKAASASSKAKPTSALSKQGTGAEKSMIVRLKTRSESQPTSTDPLSNVAMKPTTSTAKTTGTNPVLTEISSNKPNTRSKSTTHPSLSNTNTILPSSAKPATLSNIENVPPTNTSNNPATGIENLSPEEYMTRLDIWIRKYQDLPIPTPSSKSAVPTSNDGNDLAVFAAQPEAERLSAIDEMICQCIDDPNFVVLCEDVEKSWKRIGLGF